MNVKFSIITVCFNSEATIERTLKSVLAQSYPSVEYILVDGKSTDRTMEIVQEYTSKFVEKGIEFRYISEKDAGMYDAMNKGIRLSTGDIISILNSDDWYVDEALQRVAEAIKVHEADIYMGAINIYNGNQVIVKKAKNRKYKTSRDFNHPAMFVKKECYKAVGEYRIGNVHNDYEWFLRAIKGKRNIQIINKTITNYPTGGYGSKKSFRTTCGRIFTKYEVYQNNGYSKLYFIECVIQELVKFSMLRN